ncbi:MAG TPA: AraC family transcriptional regulator ligand-binding domain-containing protein [Steroidobacteraceae bacterium]|nr:AraC family transcriptional regulator ligand-binding domain-containing protein [Steroidobacteraceae bacterium]
MRVENTFVLSVDGAFDVLPSHGTIQAGYLRGLLELVRSRGCDPRKVLEHHDIDSRTFEEPDQHIECATAVNLLESCSSLLHDPLFGLRLAQRQDPDVFGCATTLARAAPSVRHALQSLIDYVPVCASPECELEMVAGREIVELRWRTDTGLGDSEQVNYQGLMLIVKTLQMLAGPQFRPRYATLTFKIARSNLQALQEHVGCKISGSASAHAIGFSPDILDRPIGTSNKMLFSLLGGYLAQLRAASKPGFVEQVEAYVRRALAAGTCSVNGCAARLGTSSRTLQKRLTRMDMKFSSIVQSERIKLARHALLRGDCTLDEIALQLGYSEQTSFGRAFKRSTGMTPQAFRSKEDRRRLLS